MRRADRLFQIVQILRSGRLVTARKLAERLEISERTVYRDMRDLMASGLPVDGEAGVGYLLRDGFDLPPIMFTQTELEAVVVGARLVRAWAGGELAQAAQAALDKIEAVLPEERRSQLASALFAPDFNSAEAAAHQLDPLRRAIRDRLLVRLSYRRADGEPSQRLVRPLAVHYWGRVWTLAGWCELRDEFRSFRLDRIADLTVLDQGFADDPGKTLADYEQMVRSHPAN